IYSHNRQSFSPSQPAPTTLHILSLHDALPISRGNHRARSRYKTIDNYRYPARCRAQDESGDRSDFKAANLCKYVQGIACIRFVRSEEHTSELQSLTNIVFRLLLETQTHQPLID